ncbi:sugar ABC transporter permease [Kribbella sp. NBC_01484]|uniref:carbohydrate ABC transporter permease n=1 Tax=Kribbella sp. NBC_01484 TaxID=2903579 RepID=UPI002E37025F|nr:sugar ABC transporter permease [Kribbella sp. NBC_01484]
MTSRLAARRNRTAGVLLAPFSVLFVAVFVIPIGYAGYQSFFRQQRSGLGLGPPRTVFAGLGNYARVFADNAFVGGVGRTVAFGLVQVPVMLGLALLLALLLDSRAVRFGRFFRLAYFLPFAIPGVIAAVLWSFLYVPGISPLVGAGAKAGVDLDFLSAHTILFSIGNIVTWCWTGYNMLILYTALQAIPRELFEAAQVDGCSGLRIAWHIKIPLLRPALTLTGVFSIIGSLQLFGEPMVLRPMTSAISNSYTPVMLSYQAAFGLNDYNFAAAIAVVLAVATFVLSYGFLRLSNRGSS